LPSHRTPGPASAPSRVLVARGLCLHNMRCVTVCYSNLRAIRTRRAERPI
jgi:hypothetical protein